MDRKFVREIITAFSKLGPVEYRIMKDCVDLCENERIIGRVKDNYLYLVDREEQLVRVADGNIGLCSNLNNKIIIAYNLRSKTTLR
jgi:hypothetical protein